MNYFFRTLSLAVLVFAGTSGTAQESAEKTAGNAPLGDWHGVLAVSGIELRLVFHIHQGEDGTLTATMDSPDQGVEGIPVDTATFANDRLRLEVKRIGGVFEGLLKDNGALLEGEWRQGGQTVALTMKAGQPATKPALSGDELAAIRNSYGNWQGTLKVSGMELRLVFKIEADEKGQPRASMDSLDQGAKDIPVTGISMNDGELKLKVGSIGGTYSGTLAPEADRMTGTWMQMGNSFPLDLEKVDRAPTLNRPQEPKAPLPYDREEVEIENREAGIKLGGTLTLPKSGGPFAAAVLVSGSGPQDRDEALMGHRPFLVLADYLTRRGLAVLRYDDRGVGQSEGDFSTATTREFADDAAAALAFLKGRANIDPGKVGIIGHSEGGLVAAMVGARLPDLAFAVLMAGPGTTGEEILYQQSRLIHEAEGWDRNRLDKNEALQKKIFSLLKKDLPAEELTEPLRTLINEEMANFTREELEAMGYEESGIDAQIRVLTSPWFRLFLGYDPKPDLRQTRCPVLAINGEKDLQVPPGPNLAAIEKALHEGGNRRVTVKEIPGLNHLFQTAETGAPKEYSHIEETFSPRAMAIIGDWLDGVLK